MSYIRLTSNNFQQRLVRKLCSFLSLKFNIFIWKLFPDFGSKFILLNKINSNILYYLIFKQDFNSFKKNLEAKFHLFEEKILVEFIIDAEKSEKNFKWDNLKVIGPLCTQFKNDSDYLFIIMKKNKIINPEQSIIFPNQVYSSKAILSEKYLNKVVFNSTVKKIIINNELVELPYPNTLSNISSPMALQRIIFFLIKYVNFQKVCISGFNLYAGEGYNRKFYPSLTNPKNEKYEIAISLINHGVIFNWEIVNHFKNKFYYDSNLKLISSNKNNYLKKLYNTFWK